MSTSEPTPDRPPVLARPPVAPPDGEPNILRHYAGVVRRRYTWILLGLAVGLLGGFISTLFVHVTHDRNSYYKATNTLLGSQSSASANGDGSTSSGTNLQQAAFLIRSSSVVDAVAKKLHVTDQEVNDLLTATARSDVQAVDVTAISNNPQQAVDMANAAATALNTYVLAEEQSQFNQQRDVVIKQLNDLEAQQSSLEAQLNKAGANTAIINAQLDSVVNQYRLTYEQLQTLATTGAPTAGMSTLQAATPVQINARAFGYRLSQNENDRGQVTGTQTVAPTFDETDLSSAPPVSKKVRVLLGGAAGLVLGIATAFLVEAWDDRLRRRDRVESITGYQVIAEIPKLSRDQAHDHAIPTIDAPGSRAAERYRAAGTSILFGLQHLRSPEAGADGAPVLAPVVLVTSPNPSEGKTTTVANVASVLGDKGLRTLVIDCDFRKPAVARYLAPTLNLLEPGTPVPTRFENVFFLAAPRGTDGPADAVIRLRRAVAEYQNQYDILLLDTPPMLTTNDASDLLVVADAVLLVLRSGQSHTGPAQRASIILSRFQAEVLGVIFNGCEDAEMESYYGYGYGYGYGLGYGEVPRPAPRPPTAPPDAVPSPPPVAVDPGALPVRNGHNGQAGGEPPQTQPTSGQHPGQV